MGTGNEDSGPQHLDQSKPTLLEKERESLCTVGWPEGSKPDEPLRSTEAEQRRVAQEVQMRWCRKENSSRKDSGA